MGFVGVYRALYDYTPNAENELPIKEGDLLFVLEKSSEDGWWSAKKKAEGDEEEEPEGLIPNNYIEEAPHVSEAKALYDYSRQTDEELSFTEDATLKVYDTTDPDWTLVGLDGEYGFVPSNYIEVEEVPPPKPARPISTGSSTVPAQLPSPEPGSPVSNPAAALAGIIQQKTGGAKPPQAPQFTPEASDEEGPPPALPRRPPSQPTSPTTPQYSAPRSPEISEPRGVQASPPPRSPGNYHLYNIHEMISHQGKNRKMPTTLGINVGKGIIMIAPEKSRDGPTKEWSADKLTHYSIEGKHVFMELVKPSKSIDFHAGAKDTAQEIVAHLGELAGAVRAEGLREVMEAGSSGGQKAGVMLYEFMAQGDDEVTVAVGDQVIILDDVQNEEWWSVRRLKNGKEGVVPSSYVEVTANAAPTPTSTRSATSRSFVEQNRLDEERLAKESVKSTPKPEIPQDTGIQPPRRQSSLHQADEYSKRSSQRTKRDTRSSRTSSVSKQKPDQTQVRTWTDRSGNFKVDAQFLGLKDNKIHLHKTNGVKIAVMVAKMSVEDLEYVEKATGESLDEDKPLSDIKKRNTQRRAQSQSTDKAPPKAGAAIEKSQVPKFDWFDFFLQCGVDPQICQRYASNFEKDQMGEESMQDINPQLLRTLGLKEGDILRVMKFLDSKFGRVKERKADGEADNLVNGDTGGIFSGPGGALRNNTRKGRPAPAIQNNDTVDPRAFEQEGIKKETPTDATATPLRTAPAPQRRVDSGFDDDAWDVKPSKQQLTSSTTSPPPTQQAAAPPPQQKPAPTGAMAELSLLSPPLQPSPAPQPAPVTQQTPLQTSSPPPQNLQSNATRAVFDQMSQPGQNPAQPQQISAPRQRPQAPQQSQPTNSLLPPPPARPSSAPQNNPPSAFGPPPLQPQMTGYQGQPAPPGQSMNDINQQRLQQQYQQQAMPPQPTGYGFGLQQQGMNGYQQYPQQPQQNFAGSYNHMQQPQPTGFQQQPYMNSQPTGSPFADPPRPPFQPQPTGFQPQPTGFQPQPTGYPPMQPQQTGVNAFLPPALQPQPTGFGGMNGYAGVQQQQQGAPPVPPLPTGIPPQPIQQQPTQPMQQPQQSPAPLQPQKTGPAPPVRFGVQDAKPLQAQPTGRRANLSMATAQNPFGF